MHEVFFLEIPYAQNWLVFKKSMLLIDWSDYLSNDKQILSWYFLIDILFKYFSYFFFIQINFGAINVTISIIQSISVYFKESNFNCYLINAHFSTPNKPKLWVCATYLRTLGSILCKIVNTFLKASWISCLGPWCQVPIPRVGIKAPVRSFTNFLESGFSMTEMLTLRLPKYNCQIIWMYSPLIYINFFFTIVQQIDFNN